MGNYSVDEMNEARLLLYALSNQTLGKKDKLTVEKAAFIAAEALGEYIYDVIRQYERMPIGVETPFYKNGEIVAYIRRAPMAGDTEAVIV